MRLQETLSLIEALNDASRLMILRLLEMGPSCGEEVAQRLDLSPSTVSFHMKKLAAAGLIAKEKRQYYWYFRLVPEALNRTLSRLLEFEEQLPAVSRRKQTDDRSAILKATFDGNIIRRLPRALKKRLVVLENVARRFHDDREYSEKEISERLKEIYPDYCLLRRELVDLGFFSRNQGIYRKTPAAALSPALSKPSTPARPTAKSGRKGDQDVDHRKELVREYKQTIQPAGLLQIRNTRDGRIFLFKSLNLPGAVNRQEFQLEMGGHPNRELQSDWKKFGKEAFIIEILTELPPHPDGSEFTMDELDELERIWLEKLRPTGDRGYHEEKRKNR